MKVITEKQVVGQISFMICYTMAYLNLIGTVIQIICLKTAQKSIGQKKYFYELEYIIS